MRRIDTLFLASCMASWPTGVTAGRRNFFWETCLCLVFFAQCLHVSCWGDLFFLCCSVWWTFTVVYDMWLGSLLGASSVPGGGFAAFVALKSFC